METTNNAHCRKSNKLGLMGFLISLMSIVIGAGCLYLLLVEKSETIVRSISGITNVVFIIFLIGLICSFCGLFKKPRIWAVIGLIISFINFDLCLHTLTVLKMANDQMPSIQQLPF